MRNTEILIEIIRSYKENGYDRNHIFMCNFRMYCDERVDQIKERLFKIEAIENKVNSLKKFKSLCLELFTAFLQYNYELSKRAVIDSVFVVLNSEERDHVINMIQKELKELEI